ncbi:DUF6132 family protein [Saccharicrinis fermentans]|uniref:DUF6132 family protein n=1 Tax=Saccharicrinis fermentans TaxID=982 RepID=UPI0004AD5BD9|nr:DUF6132 family protein [Saccharicrinis fermentans]
MKIWEKIKKQRPQRIVLAITIGAVLGYAYYYFIGCSTGSCPITSNPINSILYGGFAGLVVSIQ